jgi:hypothetical protein
VKITTQHEKGRNPIHKANDKDGTDDKDAMEEETYMTGPGRPNHLRGYSMIHKDA